MNLCQICGHHRHGKLCGVAFSGARGTCPCEWTDPRSVVAVPGPAPGPALVDRAIRVIDWLVNPLLRRQR